MSDDSQWRWRFNRWWGVMWGPIPVSLIVIIVVLASVMFFGYSREW